MHSFHFVIHLYIRSFLSSSLERSRNQLPFSNIKIVLVDVSILTILPMILMMIGVYMVNLVQWDYLSSKIVQIFLHINWFLIQSITWTVDKEIRTIPFINHNQKWIFSDWFWLMFQSFLHHDNNLSNLDITMNKVPCITSITEKIHLVKWWP